ncbi:hypothetical protein DYQ86_16285 [Acidobacteria bacterium AB60]|nr:hypothetical protein DYQ86_16285 [Acidobacteria bacterium AB60]
MASKIANFFYAAPLDEEVPRDDQRSDLLGNLIVGASLYIGSVLFFAVVTFGAVQLVKAALHHLAR